MPELIYDSSSEELTQTRPGEIDIAQVKVQRRHADMVKAESKGLTRLSSTGASKPATAAPDQRQPVQVCESKHWLTWHYQMLCLGWFLYP